MRCPNCGSSVMINGLRWECGWCGNSGRCSFVYQECPTEKDYDEIDLHNALYSWNEITEAVEVLCKAPRKRKVWAEHLAAYAISDAILQKGNFQKHRALLRQF